MGMSFTQFPDIACVSDVHRHQRQLPSRTVFISNLNFRGGYIHLQVLKLAWNNNRGFNPSWLTEINTEAEVSCAVTKIDNIHFQMDSNDIGHQLNFGNKQFLTIRFIHCLFYAFSTFLSFVWPIFLFNFLYSSPSEVSWS